ncbi:hypothetical protein Y5W_00673 [Alcanivorax sp. 521-1]|uniref:DUF1116 domain-containing protein n=1 Tax=Alloalcanivorax profundimaris TaxID=2735259 RepID=A0ABS0AMM1_9GAMM|nr:DUF1116 domain-containing protein [Alloalcanivorax profundimaris]MBF5055379.1 hypothetical protein [Alloalcanivorax profundimaris]
MTPASLAAPFAGAFWQDLVTRRQALPTLPERTLLHAGPPLRGAVPTAIRNAAVVAALFEGLANSSAQALEQLRQGHLTLAPAQDHGVATPLAQVVSAHMPLIVVGEGDAARYAPLVEGPPPAARFGTLASDGADRFHHLARRVAEHLASAVRAGPVAMEPVVAEALAEGDDCHSRTGALTRALLARLPGLPEDILTELTANGSFALTPLMAAAAWRLQDAPLSAIGGNGVDFGLRPRGASQWRTAPATPPRGTLLPGADAGNALGAIGDSAVIDACGLGGQALGLAPALLNEWADSLPDYAARRRPLFDTATGTLDPEKVVADGRPPIINLAILGRNEASGLIGRGFHQPPLSLFDLPETVS